MAKTQYFTATSLDGFIADEHNSLDWLFAVSDSDDRFSGFFTDVAAMAMGSTTYEWVVDHEQLLDHPEKWRDFYGTMPCWVFTSRDLPRIPGGDITFVRGDVAPVHAAMTAAAGERNLWLVGGGDLVGQFADQGLLDEIILSIAPVTLGAGAALLPRRLTGRLRLTAADRGEAFAHLTYAVGPPHDTGGRGSEA